MLRFLTWAGVQRPLPKAGGIGSYPTSPRLQGLPGHLARLTVLFLFFLCCLEPSLCPPRSSRSQPANSKVGLTDLPQVFPLGGGKTMCCGANGTQPMGGLCRQEQGQEHSQLV